MSEAGADRPGEGPAPGSEFAGHRIEAVIGRGGMGVVYRARNLALDRERALKVLAPGLSGDERFRRRFQRESRIAASLEHPNVVPVHEAGEEAGQLYLSMRLVDGRDLRELVAAGGPLQPERAVAIVAAVAAGLDAAHEAGLIHRDVKPANVLVGEGADAGRVYLSDFGITRTARGGETVTASGEMVGTADFLAPEQIAGDPVDRRADVYALGAVTYFALTGQPPFPRENELATLFAHANAPRPRPSEVRPGLSAALDSVVVRAMAVDPDDRLGSAGELAAALDRALEGEGTVPMPTPERAPERPRRRFAALAIAAVAAAAAVVGVLVLAGGGDGEDSSGPTPEAPPISRLAEISLAGAPKGIAVGPEAAFVALLGGDELGAVAVATDRPGEAIPLDGPPSSVAVGLDHVWAVSGETGALYRLDPGGAIESFPVGANPSDVAVDDEWVWVTLEGEDRVARVDPETGSVDSRVPVGDGPRAVAIGVGSVWVTNIEDGTLSRIDPETARKDGSAVEVGDRPADVAVGEGHVWVVNVNGGDLRRIDPGGDAGPRVDSKSLDGLGLPRGVKAGFGAVWVVTGADSRVRRVDPSTMAVTGSLAVGANPADVAVGAGSVWTADEDGDSVTRIDPGAAQAP